MLLRLDISASCTQVQSTAPRHSPALLAGPPLHPLGTQGAAPAAVWPRLPCELASSWGERERPWEASLAVAASPPVPNATARQTDLSSGAQFHRPCLRALASCCPPPSTSSTQEGTGFFTDLWFASLTLAWLLNNTLTFITIEPRGPGCWECTGSLLAPVGPRLTLHMNRFLKRTGEESRLQFQTQGLRDTCHSVGPHRCDRLVALMG